MQRLKYIYMLLCAALSMQTMLNKQNNIKLYMQQSKALIHLQTIQNYKSTHNNTKQNIKAR